MRWIALLGVLGVAATGGIAYAALHTADGTPPPPAHWGLYSDAEWTRLAGAFARRGFGESSVRLVTGTSTPNGRRSFALLSARSHDGRECFAVARGLALGAPTCRFDRPLTLYRWQGTLLALVRRQVGSVTMSAGGRTANVELPAADDRFYAFNGGLVARPATVVAHAADGAVLQRVIVR
ncbi:MAG TPA: hypothetical protein VFL60_04270 [Gaiellaceae bacterium]|nr:hypothetical protein [Gaiellaceae bacterium]